MRWYVTTEAGKWVIRGDKGNRRLPVKKYARIRHDRQALDEFVKRLNAPQDAKEKVAFKHAFINEALLDEYLRYLKAQIPTEGGAKQEFSYLKRYCLNYFIGELDLANPLDWHRVHETQWAEFLTGPKAPGAAKTKRDIIIAMNRFAGWLHKQRPEEVPPLEFKPISKAKFREIEARRQLKGQIRDRGWIKDADWKVIKAKCTPDIAPYVQLALAYGLRRSECLGAQASDVKRGYLSVERQQVRLGSYAPLKGRDRRKVTHWFARPAQAYTWLEQAVPMNPSTLTHKWNELMEELGMDYDFHDLRHTFITKALRKYPARDVQLAAGHKDIRTTMGYAHDDRSLDDEQYIPEAS